MPNPKRMISPGIAISSHSASRRVRRGRAEGFVVQALALARCAVEAGDPHDVRHRMDVSLRSLQRPHGARDAPELAWQGRWMYAHAELVKYIKFKKKAAHKVAARKLFDNEHDAQILR